MAFLVGKQTINAIPDENSEVRTRMPELCDAFDKLEKELRQHIKELHIQAIKIRWEQQAKKFVRSIRT
jgi:hypothetical protein